MELSEAIERRRSFRALEKVNVSEKEIESLAYSANLAPSCYNNHPWKFVFVYGSESLNRMHEVLSKGNEWAKKASMMIAVVGKKEDDCVIGKREYYQFDIGMSTGFLMLKATELGLVAHPIAGYSPEKAKEVLKIPNDYEVITLLSVGKKTENLDGLSENQKESEKKRPERPAPEEFAYKNLFR